MAQAQICQLMNRVLPATGAHLPGILAILNHMIRDTDAIWTEAEWDLAQISEWHGLRLASGCPVLVAVDGDRALGYASYAQFRAKDGYRHTMEHTLYVAPGQQGAGVGSMLMEALLCEAGNNGVHALVAGIDAGNAGSIRFHARHGFAEVGRMPQVGIKHGRWLDLVLMQRLI
jgi:L-amino acid N-acyltransferase YncA